MSRPFDEAKYKALLEGLEISEIPFGFLNAELRFDAEYYKKAYLSLNDRVSKFGFQTVGSLATVTDGIHASIDFSESSKINLVSAMSPKENSFDLSRGGYISEKQHAENPRTALRKGDVVISTVGTIGNCAVVDDEILPANSDRHVGIVRILKDYSPYVLSTFILSKYGRFQTLMESTGNVQLSLFLYKIRDLKIPVFKQGFQLAIENCVRRALCISRQEKSVTAVAETFLLSELGLKDWKPSKPLSYTQSSREVFESARLDSEYFYPKYTELHEKLVSDFQLKTLGETGKVLKGSSVSYSDDGAIPIIRSGNLSDISDDSKFLRSSDVADIFRLQKGDVLISSIGFGSIGKVRVFDREGVYGTVSEVTVVRQNVFNPYYLAAYLRSLAGQMQIERFITGATGQLHLYPKDVAKIFVPIISEVQQERFESLAKESATSKRDAKALLSLAKTAVETAIEQGEAAAMKLLEREKAFV